MRGGLIYFILGKYFLKKVKRHAGNLKRKKSVSKEEKNQKGKMTTINNNYISLLQQRYLNNATNSLTNAVVRLSTGQKINYAKDDAAGLYIATGLTSQIRGLNVVSNSLASSSNFLATAEGTLSNVSDNLMRMRDLALQGCSGTLSSDSRQALQNEVAEIQNGITQQIKGSNFNGMSTLAATTVNTTKMETQATQGFSEGGKNLN